MHELPILINITLALVVAFLGGILARQMGLPTIVGYLIAGIAIGPFTPGFVGDIETIQQLAELCVIFLMFGVGLHFSFQDLWRVRDIAIPGALIQTLFATLLGFLLTRFWGWSISSGVVLGLAISVASTVVLLRGLMDNKLLNTTHGQAAVGWLVMEDILSVLILVLMPALSITSGSFDWVGLFVTLLKAAAFVILMFFVGSRFIPWLLERIARTRSRELFILVVLAVTLGIAMGASELFGVSLALGAFMAGAIISQSRLSHQVGADVFAFREAFSVLFFVSIGMLVNPFFLWQNWENILWLTLLVVVGKSLIVLLMGLVFPRPARTFLTVAIGLSQIGEFSFILGQSGLKLNLLDNNQYSLILATALISITVNPFMYKLLPVMEKNLRRLPGLWKKLESQRDLPIIPDDHLNQHVVIIGFGRVGRHLVDVLDSLDIPMLVVETDAERSHLLYERNIPTIYGDAGVPEILTETHPDQARAVVITIPDDSHAVQILGLLNEIAPNTPVIARATTEEGVRSLLALGAQYIVHPELEGGLEIVHHTLLSLGFPLREVHEYAEAVRRDCYNTSITSNDEYHSLHVLLHAARNIEVTWLNLGTFSSLIGKSLAEANIRQQTGASVVALIRDKNLIANPKSSTVFMENDHIGIIGEADHVESARLLVTGSH